MRSIKSKIILSVALLCLAVAFGVFGVLSLNKTTARAYTLEIDGVVAKRVAVNTELDVPESTTVDYYGEKTATNGVIVYPDGKIVKAGKIRVNETGTYELRYFFDYSGVTCTAIQKVEVYSDYFTLSNPSGGTIAVTDENNKLFCGKDGLFVDLKSGTTFIYNKVLDLRNAGEDGLSEIIELDGRYGHFDEDGRYIPDVLEGWVRLTDCYDPNVYIELRMQKSVNYTGCLFPGVKTNLQAVTGMDKGVTQVLGPSRIITLDGSVYRVWMGSGSMNVGMYNMRTAMNTGTVWKYDMKTNRVYLSYNGGDNFLVTDLDEPLIYTAGNLFPGFTTGEVFVTIYADGYESTYAKTEIVSIGGENLKDLADKEYFDDVAPTILVDSVKTTPTGVYGAVGDEFTLPSARAIDVNLVGGVDVAVYRGYSTDGETNVSVIDGKILLSYKDVYTVVYTAKDSYGNVGKALFTVSAAETEDNRAITLIPTEKTTAKAGEKVDDLFTVTSALNVSAEDVKVLVTVEGGEQKLSGEGANFSFTPYYSGEYRITFNYTDGVFSYDKSITVNVISSDNVCFIESASVPKYYLYGNKYAIDDIKAYTFTSGRPTAVETEIFAVYDGGNKVKVGDPSAVTITGQESVYFIYKAGSETLITDVVSIINADYYNAGGRKLGYDMSKFFIGDFTATATNAEGRRIRNITYTSNVNFGDNKLTFFNALLLRKFALDYRIVSGEDNFGTLRIALTDVENTENRLTLDVIKGEDATYVSVNGGAAVKAEYINFSGYVTTVSYDFDGKFLRLGDFSSAVDFDASKAYLDIEMKNITGKASVVISTINNDTLSGNTYVDSVEPEIYVHDFQGDYVIGDTVKIAIPEFSDVLSGIDYSTAGLIIAASDGKPVLSPEGNVLSDLKFGTEYSVKLDRIAKYYVVYSVSDFNGNTAQKTVTLNCADSEKPTITLKDIKDGQMLKVKAGAEITLDFTVSDNVDKPKDITVYIHLYCVDMFSYVPNVSNIKKTDAPTDGAYSEKFTISIKGRYQAQINAMDAEGNLCVKYIDIVVE